MSKLADQITLVSKLTNHAIEINKTTTFMAHYAQQENRLASGFIDFVHGVVINDIDLKTKTITVVVRYAIFQEAEGNDVWYRDAVVTFDDLGFITNWRLGDDMWEHAADAPHELDDKVYK